MLATVHRDGFPRDVVGAGEEQHDIGDLFGRRTMSEGHRSAITRECFGILPPVRQGRTRRNSIHPQMRRQGLGERRGNAVSSALQAAGGSASQLEVISYGKEKPVCREHNEDCWGKNRRVEIVYTAQ